MSDRLASLPHPPGKITPYKVATWLGGIVVCYLPLKGTETTFAPVTAEYVDALKDAYADVNVLQELKKHKAYLMSNPPKRRTAAGLARGINSWMTTEQERQERTSRRTANNTPRNGGYRGQQIEREAAAANGWNRTPKEIDVTAAAG